MMHTTPKDYRKDIDGLRAIAVIAVILHHLNNNLLPGGYIGVDIFFVISGFLITSHIFNALKTNTFSFAAFYVKYCVKVHQFYIRIWCKNAPLKFLCSLLNSPTLAEQNLDAMHGNHIKNQKAVSS